MITFLIIVAGVILFFHNQHQVTNLEKRISFLESKNTLTKSAEASVPTSTDQLLQAVSASSVPLASTPAWSNPTPVAKTPAEHSENFAASLAKVGVVILILGVGFFLRYINSLGLIGPNLKYVIGLLAGLAMIIVAEYVKNKSQRYASLVRGGGFILWFMTLFTGAVLYKLVSLPVTLTMIIGVLIVSLIVSFKEKSETTFLIGIIGAYLTPYIMGVFMGNMDIGIQLLSYVAVVNIGVIIVATKQSWDKSVLLSFIFSWLMFATGGSYIPSDNWMTLWIFATVYGFEFLTVFIIGDIKRGLDEKASVLAVCLTSVNTFLYAGITYSLLYKTFFNPFLGFITALLGLVHFAVYGYIRTATKNPRNVGALVQFVIAITLITAAIPAQFDGPIVTMIWFVEGIVLSYLAIAPDFRGRYVMYALGFVGIILGISHMIVYGEYTNVFETGVAVFNQSYIVWMFVVLLVHAIAYIWKQSIKRDGTDMVFADQIKKVAMILMVIAQVCFVALTSREIESYGGYKQNQVQKEISAVYDDFKNYHGYNYYDKEMTPAQQAEIDEQIKVLTDKSAGIAHTTSLMEIIFFTILTVIYLLFGLVGKNVVARRMGIVALVITIGQLFIYTWSIGPVYRIIAFVGLGIILLIVSYLYIHQSKKPKLPMTALLALMLVATATVSLQAAVVPVKDWSTLSSVTPPIIVTNDNKGWYVAEIPADILRRSEKTDLSDVRLVDSHDLEIPYLLVKQGQITNLKESFDDTTTNTKILENSLLQGERIVVIDTLKEGKVNTGIDLKTTRESVNFRHIVHVYISDSALGASSPLWRELEQKSVVYNYTDLSSFAVQKLRVALPGIVSRYIKLRFEQDNSLQDKGATFTNTARVTGARILSEQDSSTQGTRIKDYLAGNFVSTLHTNDILEQKSIIENDKEKSTEVVYGLKDLTELTYINKIVLNINSANKNFKRNVTVQVPDNLDKTKWITVAEGQIYRIVSPIFTGESLSIDVLAKISSNVRVIIHNDSDQPLQVEDTIKIERQQVGMLFKKEDGNIGEINFLIGNKNAIQPTYEIQKTLAFFQDANPALVTLGGVKENPLHENVEAYVPFGEKYKSIINIGLLFFVILLGYLGYRWSR